LANGIWTDHEFSPVHGAVVTLLPVAAIAMTWRFVKQSKLCSSTRLLLWIEGACKIMGGRCRLLRQTHPR